MKKSLLIGSILFLLFGCSAVQQRIPNSNKYNCMISEAVSGNTYKFNFVPEEHLLLISGSTIEETRITLIESDFSEGGYIFKSEPDPKWTIVLNFISYKKNPLLKLSLLKSTISPKSLEFEKTCSR